MVEGTPLASKTLPVMAKNREPVMDEIVQQESEVEVKGSKPLYEVKLVAGEDPSGECVKGPDLSVVDERRHSSLYKLLRVTA